MDEKDERGEPHVHNEWKAFTFEFQFISSILLGTVSDRPLSLLFMVSAPSIESAVLGFRPLLQRLPSKVCTPLLPTTKVNNHSTTVCGLGFCVECKSSPFLSATTSENGLQGFQSRQRCACRVMYIYIFIRPTSIPGMLALRHECNTKEGPTEQNEQHHIYIYICWRQYHVQQAFAIVEVAVAVGKR